MFLKMRKLHSLFQLIYAIRIILYMLEQLEQKLMVDQILCIKSQWNDKAKVFYFSAVSYFNVLLGVLTCIVDKVYTEIASEIAKGKKDEECGDKTRPQTRLETQEGPGCPLAGGLGGRSRTLPWEGGVKKCIHSRRILKVWAVPARGMGLWPQVCSPSAAVIEKKGVR